MDKKVKLVTIGAFDPPTYGHLRMFEKAKEFLEKEKGFQVVEGIISIIPDTFRNKICTASSYHRMKMLNRALQSSRWIRADDWQCFQTTVQNFSQTLTCIDNVFNVDKDNNRISTVFICSYKFFEHVSVDESDLCNIDELHDILTNFDTIVICASQVGTSLTSSTAITLTKNQKQLYIVHDSIYGGPQSGSFVRKALAKGESIRYCTYDKVISYIYEYGLYSCQAPPIPFKSRILISKSKVKFSPTPASTSASAPTTLLRLSPIKLLSMENSWPLTYHNSHIIDNIDEYICDPSDISDNCICNDKTLYDGAIWQESLEAQSNRIAEALARLPEIEQEPPPRPLKTGTKTKSYAKSSDNVYHKSRNSKSSDDSQNLMSSSLISFTFEQHNLSYTPETTV
uniref:Cytidyltransferase-like domain-containing protein n=1 Tax=Panagrolaimus sp. PS1159 TaxID=55785 RepID=A0AC35GC04_9BILA